MPNIETWLSMQPKNIQKQLEIRSRSEGGVMYRIDKAVPRILTPRMPVSALSDENTSVPRVCVGPSLLGCIFGYNPERMLMDFKDGHNEEEGWYYRGGYRITYFDYEFCVKPGTQLVRDAKITDEHWLVSYNAETAQYKPKHVGLFFVEKVSLVVDSTDKWKRPTPEFIFLVQIDDARGMMVDREKSIGKGYWRVELKQDPTKKTPYIYEFLGGDYALTVTEVSSAEFNSKKKNNCVMLSSAEKPFFLNW